MDENKNQVIELDPAPPSTTSDDQLWAILCHMGTFATFVPFAHILVPLVIWLLKRDDSPLVADQGKEALNFQISMTIYYAIVALLCFVLIGFLFLIPLGIYEVIITIVAMVRVKEGIRYRYPMTIRFL